MNETIYIIRNTVFLEGVLYWVNLALWIIGLIGLVYQLRWSWLLLLLIPIGDSFILILDILDPYRNIRPSLKAVYHIPHTLYSPLINNAISSILLLLGFYRWSKIKNSISLPSKDNLSILDDLSVMDFSKKFNHLKKLHLVPILLSIILIGLSLSSLEVLLFDCPVSFNRIGSRFGFAIYFISLYLLGKHYLESWLVLLIVTCLSYFIFYVYPIIHYIHFFILIGICIWGYFYWKKS
ncbi:MAG: hypothetical protein GY810_10945 [Aureispira sp.]|nr:hypothetical protein [Aureispira sp.]